MIELMVGLRGTGKTKALLDKVTKVTEVAKGNVVCVEIAKKLSGTTRMSINVRLIDTVDYDITNGDELYGLMSGVIATNYDVTELFIDSALKICTDIADFEKFINRFSELSDKYKVNCFITASVEENKLSDDMKKYIVNCAN